MGQPQGGYKQSMDDAGVDCCPLSQVRQYLTFTPNSCNSTVMRARP